MRRTLSKTAKKSMNSKSINAKQTCTKRKYIRWWKSMCFSGESKWTETMMMMMKDAQTVCWHKNLNVESEEKWKKNDQITGKTTRMRNEELSPCGPLPRRLMDNHNQLTEGTTKIRTQRNSTQQKTTAQDDDGLSLYSEKTNKTMAATPVPLSRWLKNASIMQQHKQQQQQQQNRPNVKK